MNKIIKILGPSGAGKTSLVRALWNGLTVNPLPWEGLKGVQGYEFKRFDVDKPIYVLGRYDSNCGGVDTIDAASTVIKMVELFHPLGHVIHEGLLQSTYYGAMGVDSQKYGRDYVYAWLDTPKSVCMERLHARREANGTKRPLNVEQAEAKWDTVRRAYEKAGAHGHACVTLRHDLPLVPQIVGVLND